MFNGFSSASQNEEPKTLPSTCSCKRIAVIKSALYGIPQTKVKGLRGHKNGSVLQEWQQLKYVKVIYTF